MRLEVDQEIQAPRGLAWDVLTTWERQPEWMVDAIEVHVLTPQDAGVGVTLRCPTNLLGVTVQDIMRVTGWDEPAYLEVAHLGRIITGSGAFELSERGADRTHVRWWEEIDPPLGVVGEWGASTLVLPLLRRLFARSLRAFAELVEREVSGSP